MGLFKSERLTAAGGPARAASRPTILVVDDEDGNLRVLRAMFAERFQVLEARDGQEALELIGTLEPERAPSVVLSDQRMPRMTGVELFERLRLQLPNAIRIIVTGFIDVGAIVDSINRAGIYSFVVKPYDRNELLLIVERAIEAFDLRARLDGYVEQLEERVRERTQALEEQHLALRHAYAALEVASLTDPLTGLGNRRRFTQYIDGATRCGIEADSNRRSALMLVDVDHFKHINDRHGHATGDAVLQQIARVLSAHCADGDLAVRWGGEEFLLHMAVRDETNAIRLASSLRQAVANSTAASDRGEPVRYSCSVGVALLPLDPHAPEPVDWQRVLALADAALYLVKRSGRNAVACLGPSDGFLPESLVDTSVEGLIERGLLTVKREG